MKIEALKQRYENNEIKQITKKEKVRSNSHLQSYPSPDHMPAHAKSTQVYVDKANDSVLIPMNGGLVPFHISTVKSISMTNES